MSRRSGLLILAALAALALFATWLLQHLERVPVHTRSAPHSQARRNPWLALELFTARLGGKLTRSADARTLDRLPSGGTLLLDRERQHLLSPERLRHLLSWVEAGGSLIVVAELPDVADSLLDALGVVREETAPPADAAVDVWLPGARRALSIDASRYALVPGTRQPAWSAGSRGGGRQLLNYRVGRGQVTVAAGLDEQLSNWRIGARDHAELYWFLLTHPASETPGAPQLLLLAHPQTPGLGQWLWENAWPACSAAAVLVALWLWRIVPRFGRVQPQSAPSRRELREHLAAVGRYLWRSGGRAALLAPARAHFQQRLAVRHPVIAALGAAERAPALAGLLNTARQPGAPPASVAQIAAALDGAAETPQEFAEVLRTLQALENQL